MILQLVAAHCLFKQPRLRVRTIKNRHSALLALRGGFTGVLGNAICNEQRFVFTIRRFVVSQLGAALARGPEVLALAANVVRDHMRRGLQDVLRGPVILFEADDLRFRKVALELKDVTDVGASPGVDRLVLISHRAHIVSIACQEAHQFILRTIGVLILVDQQILKLAVVVIADLRRGLQEANGLEQQVVEVHGIGFEQFLAILRIDMRDFLRLGIAGIEINLLRIKHVVFCPGDSGQNGARRKLLIIDAQAPHYPFHHRLLVGFVVDHKVLR